MTGRDFTTSFDAEKNIQYLDGNPFGHIRNMTYLFNDAETECIYFRKDHKLGGVDCTVNKAILCEVTYNCPSMYITNSTAGF